VDGMLRRKGVQNIGEVVKIQQLENTKHHQSITTTTIVAMVMVAIETPSPCQLLLLFTIQASRRRGGYCYYSINATFRPDCISLIEKHPSLTTFPTPFQL